MYVSESALSGRADKALEFVPLVLSDSTECHGQHHDAGQPASERYLVESTDEMALEPEGDIEPRGTRG